VDNFAAESLLGDGRTWTSAKGANSQPVAEHALALALAGLRMFPERIRASKWGKPGGRSLYDQAVTIVGGGSIARTLIGLLASLRVHITVVRRHPDPVPGAERVLATGQLSNVVPGVLVIFLALALTPQTTGIISAPELTRIDADAWLVNVARGRHVDTPALVQALERNQIGGAALDVTEPEPLPDGHPLWRLPNCIVTPHTAGTWEMVLPLLAARIAANVAHFAAGQPLDGLIDADAGY
jgi:phosphoglycerate dehydrogenase-like enzyme